MSRRRVARGQDSLELLLDTICNTFGGVLFIAMLVILLLQQTGSSPSVESRPGVSPAEFQSLMVHWEDLAGKLSRLRENRLSQQIVIDGFAPESLRSDLERRRTLSEQHDTLKAKVEKVLTDNADLVLQLQNITLENDDVRQNLEAAEAQRTEAMAELEQELQSQVEEIRLPSVRRTSKQEIGIVLRYGRLYVWHKYGPGHRRLGLNTDDFVIVAETKDGVRVRPRPTRGVMLDASAESKAEVRSILSRFDHRTCCLAVIVRPDSYHQFRLVRDAAISLGLEYRLMPAGEDDPIADRGGVGGDVQ